jgi:hypothetical protein
MREYQSRGVMNGRTPQMVQATTMEPEKKARREARCKHQ